MRNADNRLVEIGHIGKAHGLTGNVRVRISDEAVSLFNKHTLFYLKNRRGDFIPARITELQSEQIHNQHSFFVKFDRIADRSQAESFQDTPVFVDSDLIADQSLNDPENFIGYRVTDETGFVGIVNEILENPAHPIIIVEIPDLKNKNLLIPWVDEYVLSVDKNDQQIECQNLYVLKEL